MTPKDNDNKRSMVSQTTVSMKQYAPDYNRVARRAAARLAVANIRKGRS